MPVEANPQATTPDVVMNQAPGDDVQIVEVEEFPGPKPAPPFDPIIEDAKEDDQMDTSAAGEPKSGTIETVAEIAKVERALWILDVPYLLC